MPKGEYLQYGGQAIIEGVMMRSPRFFSVACRAPNGDIVLTTEAIEKTWIGRQKWLKYPFLRGSLALLDAIALGVKSMRFASNVQLDPDYQDPNAPVIPAAEPKAPWQIALWGVIWILVGLGLIALLRGQQMGLPIPAMLAPESIWVRIGTAVGAVVALFGVFQIVGANKPPQPHTGQTPKRVQDAMIGGTILVSLLLGVLLFNYVPNLIAESLRNFGVTSGTLINFATEIVKIIFFLGYIALIGQMKEIQEVFKYHGAEHKAINALEADQALTMSNCRDQTRLHPRCGTSFAIVVLLVSLVVSTLVPRYILTGEQGNYLLDVSARFLLEVFLLLPIISGASYELIRVAARFRNSSVVNVLFRPGLMSQYLTTREPEDKQIEVALVALQACLDAEEGRAQETRSPKVISADQVLDQLPSEAPTNQTVQIPT